MKSSKFPTADDFFAAVQAELDAGREPLDCVELVAWLEEHAQFLDEFASLRAVHVCLKNQSGKVVDSVGNRELDSSHSLWSSRRILFLAAAALLLVVLPQFSPTSNNLKSESDLSAVAEVELRAETETETQVVRETEAEAETESPPSAPPPSTAILLSVGQSMEQHTTESNFTAPDSNTGVVILSMRTSTRRTIH